MIARGALRQPGGMNKLEADYASHLEARKMAGEVAWFMFEGMKLRLADATFYTPDFAVMLANGEMECHETKGFWQDDARVKIKVAARTFPFRFIAVTKPKGDGWRFESFDRGSIKPVPPATSIAPKSDAGPLAMAVSGSSRRARPSSVQAAQLQSESEVMPNDGVPGLRNDARKRNMPRPHVASPREGARRVKSSKGVTEAALASWRPGDPIPDGFAVLNGRLVKMEYALDLVRK